MDYITIDHMVVPIEGEKNVLSLIRKAGIDLPTFCYHSELSIYGACRMCVVEDDRGRMFASCSEQPRPGMVIYTNTPKVRHHRKMILELLLGSHCSNCNTCHKNGDCTLQDLSHRLAVDTIRFTNNRKQRPVDMSSPSIVRDPNKCILCGDCVRTCDEVQGVGALDFAFRGAKTEVMPAFNKSIAETDCVGCGQCRSVCPTGAITIRTNRTEVWEAIDDPKKRVVAQIAPAVRLAVGDSFGIPKGENSMGKLVAALRRLGFDEVYDTNFGADLTVMEESRELAERLQSGENLPLFTSCCPGWVKYCETKYPEFAKNISTCRSPQGMFSALTKEYYREKDKEEGRETFIVSIMPCTAKKSEILRKDNFTDGIQDTDIVITTTEIVRMIKYAGIKFTELADEATDMPFGLASGGAAIFGVTGGVTEAVLRAVAPNQDYTALQSIGVSGIRGDIPIKETTVTVGGRDVKIAVVNGLGNAGKLLDKMKAGEIHYDFVEVMACRRGCILGGGQPVHAGPNTKRKRQEGIYRIDLGSNVRFSNKNPILKTLYNDLLAGKEHKLLHRNLKE